MPSAAWRSVLIGPRSIASLFAGKRPQPLAGGNRGVGAVASVTAGEHAALMSSPTATLVQSHLMHAAAPLDAGGAQAAVSDGSAFSPGLDGVDGVPQIGGPAWTTAAAAYHASLSQVLGITASLAESVPPSQRNQFRQ
jgi:hypothetical protein